MTKSCLCAQWGIPNPRFFNMRLFSLFMCKNIIAYGLHTQFWLWIICNFPNEWLSQSFIQCYIIQDIGYLMWTLSRLTFFPAQITSLIYSSSFLNFSNSHLLMLSLLRCFQTNNYSLKNEQSMQIIKFTKTLRV